MPLYDFGDFSKLSGMLTLQLSAPEAGLDNVAAVILKQKKIPDSQRDVIKQVLRYLVAAYGQRRRRLGPQAVLHPLRATALLARSAEETDVLDLLTCLLHDKLEDLTSERLGPAWEQAEGSFRDLLKSIDPKDEWFLMERLDWLTRRMGETYFQYIGRLLDHAEPTPALVRVKLADRLDNVLDLRLDLVDPLDGQDFFATLFQLLFVNSFPGHVPELPHPPSSPLHGAKRLYQMFKAAVVMSIVRRRNISTDDPSTQSLFDALATASMREAQRIVLHICGYHLTELVKQRGLLMEVMDYAQKGNIDKVTHPDSQLRLDGLFLSWFEDRDAREREKKLNELYQDKALMLQAAVAFVVIFLSFLDDPHFYIRGISEEGLRPKS
jgi:hypothetical protein